MRCALLAALVIALPSVASAADTADAARNNACPAPRASIRYEQRVAQALSARSDLWGERLLAGRNGPTYERARRYMAPLLYASGRGRRPLTDSGVYYLPFSFPLSVYGQRAFALHVADGSQIVSRRAGGRSLTVLVGPGGRERYGSCLARLAHARLGGGYLPILQTAYVDGSGIRYRQESFAARVRGTTSLVSFVHVAIDARAARAASVLRLRPSLRGLVARGGRLFVGRRALLAFSAGGRFDGATVRYPIRRGATSDVYLGWVHRPAPVTLVPDRAGYESARDLVTRFWQGRLAGGLQLEVPERRVLDAERNLLIQQIASTWRYSVGNPYEELSFAEAQDVAQVLAGYGYDDVAKAILRFSLTRLPERFTGWRAGEILVAAGTYYRLGGDRAFLEQELPRLRRIVEVLARQIEHRSSRGLLEREIYSSDIARRVYGLHGQAVVWQGLSALARVWAETGHPRFARRARLLAARLEAGLGDAVRASRQTLPDGSLFVPAALLDGGRPFDHLMDSREGSYWNLVTPYALASGLFRPRSPEANGLLRYLEHHGSRLLGLVRSGGYLLYGTPSATLSGVDQVYGVNVSRFLADQDQPDQLALTLYGTLAGAMSPDTFVSGEGATVAPLDGAFFRTMYLPPNSGGNAAFLETLRLMLVHETRGPAGGPTGLELAFATPRRWLGDGKRIAVHDAPTSFGPVSYSIERHRSVVRVILDPPASSPPTLRLRLRLPDGEHLGSVRLAGRPIPVERSTGTIQLAASADAVEVLATVVAD